MLATMLNTFSFAFAITAPIFIVLFLGALLKKRNFINDDFISSASRLVYNLGLPVMLFNSAATADFSQISDPKLLLSFALTTFIIFYLSLITAHWFTQDKRDEGVIIQGAFRGNLVILGLAFCANAYGQNGVALATLPVAMTVVIYNVLSVYVLNRSLLSGSHNLVSTFKGIIKNPLIIAIALGLTLNSTGLSLPKVLLDTSKYLSQMVLPLALLCIGGALDISNLWRMDSASGAATLWKLIASPLIACALALALGIRGEQLAILFLLIASPTATVSFVMVQALKGNGRLAANIIAQTTLWSMLSVTCGLCVLQLAGLI